MGMSFSSTILHGVTQAQVLHYFQQQERTALVSPTENCVTVIYAYARRYESIIALRFGQPAIYQRGETAWEPLVRDLSATLHCVALTVEVLHSDFLLYELYDSGRLIDEYTSHRDPYGAIQASVGDAMSHFELFDRPLGEHAEMLCHAFACNDPTAVLAELASAEYYLAEYRYSAIISALGLPAFAGNSVVMPVKSGPRPIGFVVTTKQPLNDTETAPRNEEYLPSDTTPSW